jgi:hypothetical protein
MELGLTMYSLSQRDRKGQHTFGPDTKPHISVTIATEFHFSQSPPRSYSGVHVYSNQDDPSQGYAAWQSTGTNRRAATKMSSEAVQRELARALANNLGAGPEVPLLPSVPEASASVAEAPSAGESQI